MDFDLLDFELENGQFLKKHVNFKNFPLNEQNSKMHPKLQFHDFC